MRGSLLIVLAGVVVAAAAACPPNAKPSSDGSKCFLFVAAKMEFLGAEKVCEVFGGHLASIDNAADNEIVKNGAKDQFEGKDNGFWIGGNNFGDFASWKWTGKSRFGFTNWAAGEGQHKGGNCVSASSDGKWIAAACCDLKDYVCERPTEIIATCPPSPTCPPGPTSCPVCPTQTPTPTQAPTGPPTTSKITDAPTQPPTTSTESSQPPTAPPTTSKITDAPTQPPTTSTESSQPPTGPPTTSKLTDAPTQPPTTSTESPPPPTGPPTTSKLTDAPTQPPTTSTESSQPPTAPPTTSKITDAPTQPPTTSTESSQPPTGPPTTSKLTDAPTQPPTTSTESPPPPTGPPTTSKLTDAPTQPPTTSTESPPPPTGPPTTSKLTDAPTQPPTTSTESSQPPTAPPTTSKITDAPTQPPTSLSTRTPPPGCNPNPCGANADCSNTGDKVTCICRPGHTGDPFAKGCNTNTSTASITGDPHVKTFDGTYYDYQGTCPFVFSQTCKLPAADPKFYSVKAKNRKYHPAAGFSWLEEIEVSMAEQKIHINAELNLTVNGLITFYPFYFPSRDDSKVSIELRGGSVFITNRDNVVVTFTPYSLHLTVPQFPEFVGKNSICGFAGNLNNNCTEDLVGRDGTTLSNARCVWPKDIKTLKEIAVVMDTWLTDDFNNWKGTCEKGDKIVERLPNSTSENVAECAAIKQALTAEGPFAACQGLGKVKIESTYDYCVYDANNAPGNKCRIFQEFVRVCQQELGEADVSSWRSETGCPLDCAKITPFSTYTACMSGCQATCADRNPGDKCDKPCHEGCQCDAGYIRDNSQNPAKCVKAVDCPCTDEQGNAHPKGTRWAWANCSKKSFCRNGRILTGPMSCPSLSHCGVKGQEMTCNCDAGLQWNQDETACVTV